MDEDRDEARSSAAKARDAFRGLVNSPHDVSFGTQNMKGLNGAHAFEWTTTVKHGAGQRYVEIHVKPDTILALAAAMASCPSARSCPGHAAWHLERMNFECCGDPQPECLNCHSKAIKDWRKQPPKCLVCETDGFSYVRSFVE